MSGGITSLASNPNSTVVVVGGAEGEVRAVNLSKGEVVAILEGHKEGESVEAIEFVDWGSGSGAAANAGIVVTGATDGKVCVWDLATMKLRATLEHQVSLVYL